MPAAVEPRRPVRSSAGGCRADVAVAAAGLARSRTHAAALIAAGRVDVDRRVVDRPARVIPVGARLRVRPVALSSPAAARQPASAVAPDWVSRGAVKLLGALTAMPHLRIPGRRCLDVGAATGGFTEVLLAAGAREVVAVDVGRAQLADSLQTDSRVRSLESTTIRGLPSDCLGGQVNVLVADISFISLRTVLPDLDRLTRPDGDQLLLVKPQFEVGRAALPRNGVVRDRAARAAAVLGVAAAGAERGWQVVAAAPSVLPGPAGNVEFFLWLQHDPVPVSVISSAAIEQMVEAG